MENKRYEKLLKKLEIVFNNGNYPKAINISNKLLKYKDMDNLAIYNHKSVALSKLERFNEAVDVIDEALKIYPNDSRLISNKATYLIGIDEEKALIELKKALKVIDEDDDEVRVSTLFNIASILKNNCQYEESLKSFNELLKIYPDDLEALEGKIDILIKLKEYDEGIKTCDKILDIDPSNMKAIINKSGILNSLGKTRQSIETLEKLRDFGHSEKNIILNRGIISMHNGEYEEGLNYLNQLLEENPHDYYVIHYIGRLYEENGDYNTSLEHYDNVLENHADLEIFLNTCYRKGLVLNKLKRYQEALKCFELIPDELKEFEKLKADGKKEAIENLKKLESNR